MYKKHGMLCRDRAPKSSALLLSWEIRKHDEQGACVFVCIRVYFFRVYSCVFLFRVYSCVFVCMLRIVCIFHSWDVMKTMVSDMKNYTWKL